MFNNHDFPLLRVPTPSLTLILLSAVSRGLFHIMSMHTLYGGRESLYKEIETDRILTPKHAQL